MKNLNTKSNNDNNTKFVFYPLNDSQNELFVDFSMNPQSTKYNLATLTRIGNYSVHEIEIALQQIIKSHKCYNTKILEKNDEIVQYFDDENKDFNISIINDESFDETKAYQMVKPFDLLKDTLYRFTIIDTKKSVFVFSDVHHIIFDGMSITIFEKELEEALTGQKLIAEEVNLFDYALKEKEILKSDKMSKARAFYSSYLNDATLTSYFASKNPDGTKIGHLKTKIDGSAIKDFVSKYGVSPNSFFHAVFGEVVQRLTREKNPIYCTITSGRKNITNLGNACGMFVKTLPAVYQSEKTNTKKVYEFIQETKNNLGQLYENDFYPFSLLQEEFGIKNDLMFIYQGGFKGNKNTKDISWKKLDNLDWDFSISVEIFPCEDDFAVEIEYDGMKYNQKDIQIFANCISTLALNMANYPEATLSELSLVTDEQKKEITEISKGETFDYDKSKIWLDLFFEQVKKNPAKTAVFAQNGTFTYKELDDLSWAFACYLKKQGIAENQFVAIRMGRVKEFYICAIALHKINAAYVPLDEEYPEERVKYILEDCQSKVLINEKYYETAISSYNPNSEEIAKIKSEYKSNPENHAYMIYTSGSTGKPKGVVIQQKAMYAFVNFIRTRWHLNEASRTALHSNFAFDASIEDLYPTLTCGGTVFIVPEEERHDISLMREYIKKNQINGGCYSTQFGQLLMAEGDLPLNYICVGGEKMTVVPQLSCPIYNSYGPTEFTVDATYFELEKGKIYDNIPIGRPLYNCFGFVIDTQNNLVPIGCVGELCLAGPQMAKGYWNRPELTDEKFSYINIPEKIKVYHTGDLVRYNEQNQLEYLGRIDFQVKLRGFRIELGEIEKCAGEYEGVKNVIALVINEKLVLYYSADKQLDEQKLKMKLKDSLAEFMIPDVIMYLPEMPLNVNGKIDRKKLPAPEIKAEEIVLPENEIQEKLLSFAKEICDVKELGITSNLISYGLSSIKAMKLCAKIKSGFNKNIRVTEIIKKPTVKQIALMIDEKSDAINTIQSYQKQELYPLTENQTGIFIEYEMKGATTEYNIPVVYKFDNIDEKKLYDAIQKAFAVHNYLNTTFVNQDENIMQKPNCLNQAEITQTIMESEPTIEDLQKKILPFELIGQKLYRIEIIKSPKSIYLFMDIHHIIYDGISSGVFVNDILSAYNGDSLECEKITAYDFALYEKEIKKSSKYNEAENYYRYLLSDYSNASFTESTLSDDKKVSVVRLNVEKSKISDFCKKYKITENSFFQTALGEVLYRFTGTENPLYLTVSNGRGVSTDLLDCVGMFVKTLPAVYKTNGGKNQDKSVVSAINDVQKQLQETYAFDYYPYTKLSEDFDLTPQIIFTYQGDISADSKNVPFSEIELEPSDAKFPISIFVLPKNDYFELLFEYDGTLFNKQDINSIATALKNCALSMTEKEKIGEIQLSTTEDYKIFEKFNATEYDYDNSKTVIDLLKSQAIKTPDKTAIVFEKTRYSYKQYDEYTDNLSAKLISLGIKKDDVVSILIARSHLMPLLAISVLKSGAAYQPLDPTYPVDRLNFMVKDSEAKIVICDDKYKELLTEYKGTVILTSQIAKDGNCGNKVELNAINSENIAETKSPFILLYTSGTTGVPKGVILEHQNLVAFINWFNRKFEMNEQKKCAAYASFGFDANMMDTYPVLCSGGELHILSEEIRLDLQKIDEYFIQNEINISFMTTQVGRAFAQITECKSLKIMHAGGEKLTPFMPQDYYTFYNDYGPTECTIVSSTFCVKDDNKLIPIGIPNDNIKFYIVDKFMNLLPFGATGELCISGPQVGRGYLNRPDKTAEVFLENPFTDDKKYQRLYRTGDICRWLSDGNVEIIARRDGQVKIRGFRIELTEVEKIISDYPDVKQACVIAKDAPTGGKMLVAYITGDKNIDISALNEFILKDKPPYRVPAVTMQIEEIPLNVNGKVDKRKLPEPVFVEEKVTPPQTEMQKEITQQVSELLGFDFDRISVTQNLVQYGLSSIGMLKLNLKLARIFDVPLKTIEIKENETIEKLEKLILSKKATSKNTNVYEKLPDYPLSMNQMGIYVECISNPGTTMYNIPSLFKISNELDIQKLKQALENTVNAHPYLKATLFTNQNGDIRAKRNDEQPAIIDIVKIDSLDKPETLVKPYNILEDRLYRIQIIQTANDNYLYIDVHHIICDGTSLGIIIEDLEKAYNDENLEIEQYTGFESALDEEKLRTGESYTKAKEYYTSLLKGVDTECSIPSSPEKIINNEKSLCGELQYQSSIDYKKICDFCEKNKISQNAYFSAVFGYVLCKYLYREDAVFTTIYNGRNDSRLEKSVSMLVKTFPVYVNVEKNKEILDLIKTTQKQLTLSMANDIYSFAEISKTFNVSADIQFIFQGDTFDFNTICGKNAENIILPLDTAKFGLDIKVFILNGKVVFLIEYKTEKYSKDFVKNLIDILEKCCVEFILNTNLKDVNLLTENAKKIYEKLNDNDEKKENVSLSTLFERAVSKNLDKIAVIANKESLTFNQLNKFANRVANALIARGVHKDSIIGMVFDRTKEIFIAEQGILKSGGAFLPMVEEYPDDRISYCLQDAQSPFVLTTEKIKSERTSLFESCKPCEVLTIEQLIEEGSDGCRDNNPNVNIPSDSLAYCIYTSGSTGKPKGVMIEQRNIVNYVSYSKKNLGISTLIDDISIGLSITSIAFDMSLNERMVTMCNGITIVMATLDQIHNPLQLKDLMEEHKVETIVCTPSFLSSLYDLPELHPSLKRLKGSHIGGEQVPQAIVDKIKELNPAFHFINSYGPTETVVACSSAELQKGEKVTIGTPGPNIKFFIVDKQMNVLPSGVMGELLICGPSVGRGYVNLPDKTAKSFVEFNGMRAYHSGDKVRISTEGKIECFGRLDNQVKLRGLRIELDEIENVIGQFESVKLAKVIVRNNGTEDYLAGFFTASSFVDIAELKEFMKTKLTPYMIPDVLMQLKEMPLNTNGKIDKKALPETNVSSLSSTEYVAPENEIEKLFCELYAKILKKEKVGVTDDFFKIGGTSLSATKVVAFAVTHGYDIVYKNVFANPTPRQLAKFVESHKVQSVETPKSEQNSPVIQNGTKNSIRPSLAHNVIEEVDDISYKPIGNVLLTGCTGYLGVHVLRELLQTDPNRKLFCIIRKGKASSAISRLKTMLGYYFGDSFDADFEKRISLIESDITDPKLDSLICNLDFDTIINCAACVKHFAADDQIEKVNLHGVENLIDIAVKKKVKLIQASTTSVAGEGDERFPESFAMTESMCDFGQTHENQYIDSKLKAELAVLDAIEKRGLVAKIVRFGNLSSRIKDGEFQINARTNGFMRSLKAYKILGVFPVTMMDSPLEFSPIDMVAKALVLLCGTPDKFTVFNCRNCHYVHMANIIEAFNNYGVKIDIVKEKEFNKLLSESLEDESKNIEVSSLLSYESNSGKQLHMINADTSFTVKALYRLGFSWPVTGLGYITKFLDALKRLGFFR